MGLPLVGQPQLQTELKTNLNYLVKPHIKKTKNKKEIVVLVVVVVVFGAVVAWVPEAGKTRKEGRVERVDQWILRIRWR